MRLVLSDILEGAGFSVEAVDTVAAARARIAAAAFDLVISDKNLPDGSGLDLARDRGAFAGDAEFILMTSDASVDSAVQAIQLDIADYLLKPFEPVDVLLARVRKVLTVGDLKRSRRDLVRELREKNEYLESMVVRDVLTGLFNHAYLQDVLERELRRSQRYGFSTALALIDIDHFKRVNDTHGHEMGDKLIRVVGGLLAGTCRTSDASFRVSGQEVAGRFGPDVLALILPETSKSGGAVLAERMRSLVEGYDFAAEGLPSATISIGVAAFPEDASSRVELIAAADGALEMAKQAGRNRMFAFGPGIAAAGREQRAQLETELAMLAALDRSMSARSFRYVYQPIVDAVSTEIVAYEALCRPTDPAFPSPLDLIGTAERSGRISELGKILRELAVAPLPQLEEPALLFLNIHPLELTESLLDETESLVLPWARRIVLEVTENTAIKSSARIRAILSTLKSRGFRIALDDLGAGYASLNSLALLEPDFVKLDMEMLRGIHSNSRSARLIKHILEFAREEGMTVVAEGIETAEERDVVRSLGCHLLQGYLFSRPEAPFSRLVGGRS